MAFFFIRLREQTVFVEGIDKPLSLTLYSFTLFLHTLVLISLSPFSQYLIISEAIFPLLA